MLEKALFQLGASTDGIGSSTTDVIGSSSTDGVGTYNGDNDNGGVNDDCDGASNGDRLRSVADSDYGTDTDADTDDSGTGKEDEFEAHNTRSSRNTRAADKASLALALAKLLFQQSRKSEALDQCARVYRVEWYGDNACSSDLAEAYQLAGWIRIHNDDHTGAYRVWSEGHSICPTDVFLKRQAGKRECWDANVAATAATSGSYCGDSASVASNGASDSGDSASLSLAQDMKICTQNGLLSSSSSYTNTNAKSSTSNGESQVQLHSYHIASNLRECPSTSARALYSPATQGDALVFSTVQPVLSEEECGAVLGHVDAFIEKERDGMCICD